MIESLIQNHPTLSEILIVLGSVYSLATVIANLTPTDRDNKFLSKVGRLFDRIGLKLKTEKES